MHYVLLGTEKCGRKLTCMASFLVLPYKEGSMATTKQCKTVNLTPKRVEKIAEKKRKKSKSPVVVICIIIAIIAFYFSDFWPWPSASRINDRLEKVIDACENNNKSRACKEIQKKYNMTFKYCKNLYDDVMSGKIYAVAWEGSSSEPPKNKTYFDGKWTNGVSSYYGCGDSY